MISTKSATTVLCLTLILGACAGTRLEEAGGVSPQGSEFQTQLYDGYLDLASSEFDEGDYRDSDGFADRAIIAASGNRVEPEKIDARDLPAEKIEELSTARQRLIRALSSDAAEAKPVEAARAQVMFDCWMQEQEENLQPADIEACRSEYFVAVGELETSAPPKKIAQPDPAPASLPGPFVVYFDFDQAKLTSEGRATLEDVLRAASASDFSKIVAIGHTDLAGDSRYNSELSKKRAKAVADFLIDSGIARSDLAVSARGQEEPLVVTEEGQREQRNRRVEVKFLR